MTVLTRSKAAPDAASLRTRLIDAIAKPGAPSSDYDLNANQPSRTSRGLLQAAVLVAVMETPRGPQVLLTKRSSALAAHPGQVAFPGGKRDEGDADLTHTALREAEEEIGLAPEHVEVLGHLPSHDTVTGFQMTPVVAWLRGQPKFRIDPNEVAELFYAPAAHVLDPQRFLIEGRMWRGTRRRYYTVPFGPYYIWGATARILRGLAYRVAT